ncbi:MAG: Rpn family recombination-promoting nuclease/putative transposase [Lachnospiraceae bacterium]|nr:Rpn family recombination-promoting nuclease/putative transposase [Lachnospiraceae bacterium]
MQENKQEIEGILNSQVRDSGGKIIFGDNTLCSQFLRDYIPLPYLKDVQPEDIEDVSDRFVPLFAEERNADRVKKVNIRGEKPFFLVSLIEHKTHVDYNVCMQIFRYMVYIWDAYEKEEEQKQKGISKLADFKYPVILPIVYYEGAEKWTVPKDFKSRIQQGEAFGKYVPDFEYYLVPLKDYSNEELLDKADEISLVMLINKLQTPEDVEKFRRIPPQKLEEILKETPKHLLDIIGNVLLAFLLKENVQVEEAEDLAGKVREKKMGMLFENMEKMDIQEERRKTEEQRRRAEEAEQKAEEAKQKAEETMKKLEDSIRLFVESCQEFGISRASIKDKLVGKFDLDMDSADQVIANYFKEN